MSRAGGQKVAKDRYIGEVRSLTRADLTLLEEHGRENITPPLQRIRASHHMIARLAALGLRTGDIARKTGYVKSRISILLGSPAMKSLIAEYQSQIHERFLEETDDFFELATQNMMAAERHLADRIAELDETGDLLSVKDALAISRDAADRFGYHKNKGNLNTNIDFAAQLERTLARSRKGEAVGKIVDITPKAIGAATAPAPLAPQPPEPAASKASLEVPGVVQFKRRV